MTAKKLTKLLIFSFSLSWGCKTDKPAPNPSPPNLSDTKLALIEEKEIFKRDKVHAIRLDASEFRINALRIGEQTFLNYATPILLYEMPPEADYVDILRCPSNVIIHGGADTLDYVELGSKDLETETRIYQRNNFWEAAATTSGCILIASSYTDTSFEDTFSPTGEFNYYVRACVDRERLTATQEFSTINCSRQVSRSTNHKHTNKRARRTMEAMQKASDQRGRIDTLDRQIVNKTILLNSQFFDCQKRHQKRVIDQEKKKAIGNILATSIAIGLPVLGYVGFRARQKFKPSHDYSSATLIKSQKNFLNKINKFNDQPSNTQALGSLKKEKDQFLKKINRHESILNDKIKIANRNNQIPQEQLQRELATLNNAKKELSNLQFQTNTKITAGTKTQELSNFLQGNKKGQQTTSNRVNRSLQVLSSASITSTTALVLHDAYTAGSGTIAGYPSDVKECYKTTAKDLSSSKLCTCSEALATQKEIYTLATDLEQQLELQQMYLNQAEQAEENAAGEEGE